MKRSLSGLAFKKPNSQRTMVPLIKQRPVRFGHRADQLLLREHPQVHPIICHVAGVPAHSFVLWLVCARLHAVLLALTAPYYRPQIVGRHWRLAWQALAAPTTSLSRP